MSTGRPPRFNSKVPGVRLAPAVAKMQTFGKFRGSPRDRGYDSKWDRLSIRFRKQNPMCRFCAQLGRDSLTEVTDHIVPWLDQPELKYDWKNLQALCGYCHRVTKQQMEIYARANGLLDKLPLWSEDPRNRPVHLQPMAIRVK